MSNWLRAAIGRFFPFEQGGASTADVAPRRVKKNWQRLARSGFVLFLALTTVWSVTDALGKHLQTKLGLSPADLAFLRFAAMAAAWISGILCGSTRPSDLWTKSWAVAWRALTRGLVFILSLLAFYKALPTLGTATIAFFGTSVLFKSTWDFKVDRRPASRSEILCALIATVAVLFRNFNWKKPIDGHTYRAVAFAMASAVAYAAYQVLTGQLSKLGEKAIVGTGRTGFIGLVAMSSTWHFLPFESILNRPDVSTEQWHQIAKFVTAFECTAGITAFLMVLSSQPVYQAWAFLTYLRMLFNMAMDHAVFQMPLNIHAGIGASGVIFAFVVRAVGQMWAQVYAWTRSFIARALWDSFRTIARCIAWWVALFCIAFTATVFVRLICVRLQSPLNRLHQSPSHVLGSPRH